MKCVYVTQTSTYYKYVEVKQLDAYNLLFGYWKFRNNWSKLINGEFHQGSNYSQSNIMWSMYEISAVYPEDMSGQNENS